MRIIITDNHAQVFGETQSQQIFQQQTPYSKIGIFWWAKQEYLGGWLKLPLACTIEFEAFSYTIRRIGQMTTLEILVETKNQLIQLAHQLIDCLDNWRLPVEIASDPPTYEIFQEITSKITAFLTHLATLQQRFNNGMTLHEAHTLNWDEINYNIATYQQLVNEPNLPERLSDRYQILQTDLAKVELQFKKEQIMKYLLELQLRYYSESYDELTAQYKAKMNIATLKDLNYFLGKARRRMAQLQVLWNDMRSILQKSDIQKYEQSIPQILTAYSKFIDSLQFHCQELETR